MKTFFHTHCQRLCMPAIGFIIAGVLFGSPTYAQPSGQEGVLAKAVRIHVTLTSHLLEMTSALSDVQDGSNKALSRFGAVISQSSTTSPDNAFAELVLQPQIDAIEKLVNDLPAGETVVLGAFSEAAVYSARAVERRRLLRYSVVEVTRASLSIESGGQLIAQYKEVDSAIDKTVSRLLDVGDKFSGMLAMGSTLPYDLLITYPNALRVTSNKLDAKRRKGEQMNKASRDALKMRVTLVAAALSAEQQTLRAAHRAHQDKERAVSDLKDQVDDLDQQVAAAENAAKAAEAELANAQSHLQRTRGRESLASNRLGASSAPVRDALAATQNAYDWCPVKASWGGCDHGDWKTSWLKTSLHSTALAYRAALQEAVDARAGMAEARSALASSESAERTAKNAAARTRDDLTSYRSALKSASGEYGKADDQLKRDKYDTRIDLLWQGNASDATELQNVRKQL